MMQCKHKYITHSFKYGKYIVTTVRTHSCQQIVEGACVQLSFSHILGLVDGLGCYWLLFTAVCKLMKLFISLVTHYAVACYF